MACATARAGLSAAGRVPPAPSTIMHNPFVARWLPVVEEVSDEI